MKVTENTGCSKITRDIPTPLFDLPPVSHRNDPEASRIAERKITESGERLSHIKRIERCLERYGAQTSADIAYVLDLTYTQVEKRISDLKNKKKVIAVGSMLCPRRGEVLTIWKLKEKE